MRADPASQGFGMTNGCPSCSARNSVGGELVLISRRGPLVALDVRGARAAWRSGIVSASVPVIGVGALRSGDPAALRGLAREIGVAAREIGFFSIVNHGIPESSVAAASLMSIS